MEQLLVLIFHTILGFAMWITIAMVAEGIKSINEKKEK